MTMCISNDLLTRSSIGNNCLASRNPRIILLMFLDTCFFNMLAIKLDSFIFILCISSSIGQYILSVWAMTIFGMFFYSRKIFIYKNYLNKNFFVHLLE